MESIIKNSQSFHNYFSKFKQNRDTGILILKIIIDHNYILFYYFVYNVSPQINISIVYIAISDTHIQEGVSKYEDYVFASAGSIQLH